MLGISYNFSFQKTGKYAKIYDVEEKNLVMKKVYTPKTYFFSSVSEQSIFIFFEMHFFADRGNNTY